MNKKYRGYPTGRSEKTSGQSLWSERLSGQNIRNEKPSGQNMQTETQSTVLQPYMIWRREEQNPVLWDAERRMEDDWDYMRGFYPMEAKRLLRLAETEFDRIDHQAGPMYDAYPDREFLYQVLEVMLAAAAADGLEADRGLMQVIMLNEWIRRRIKGLYLGNDIQRQLRK